MATILTSDLTRETTVKVDEREIVVTLTETQNISMKLKGMKSGVVEIPIEMLYHQLKKSVPSPAQTSENVSSPIVKGIDITSYRGDDNLLMSVAEFRSAVLVHNFDLETTYKLESFLAEFIRSRKQRKGLN